MLIFVRPSLVCPSLSEALILHLFGSLQEHSESNQTASYCRSPSEPKYFVLFCPKCLSQMYTSY